MLNYSEKKYNNVLEILRNKDYDKYKRLNGINADSRNKNEEKMSVWLNKIQLCNSKVKAALKDKYVDLKYINILRRSRNIYFRIFCKLAEKEFDVTL